MILIVVSDFIHKVVLLVLGANSYKNLLGYWRQFIGRLFAVNATTAVIMIAVQRSFPLANCASSSSSREHITYRLTVCSDDCALFPMILITLPIRSSITRRGRVVIIIIFVVVR